MSEPDTSDVLLVYGSRALADTAEAREFACGYIYSELAMLADGTTVLSGGCEDSPDAWTRNQVLHGELQDRRLVMVEFRLDGLVWVGGEPTDESWLSYAPAGSEAQRGTPKWPLRRDDAMATALLRAMRRRRRVRSFAVRAPWSVTHGTDYMTDHLHEDIPWSVVSCPVDLGPPDKVEAMWQRIATKGGKW